MIGFLLFEIIICIVNHVADCYCYCLAAKILTNWRQEETIAVEAVVGNQNDFSVG